MATYEIGFKGGQRISMSTPNPANLIAQLKNAAASGLAWYTADGLDEPYLICVPEIAYLIPAPGPQSAKEAKAQAIAKAAADAVGGNRKPLPVDLK